jgi:hypothetical protein
VTLDNEIANAAGVLGLLLVFVFGYFSALLPVILSLLDAPRPDVADDRLTLAARLASYRLIVGGVWLLTALVLLLMLPLSSQVVASIRLGAPFATIRAGLLAMDGMLLTLLVAAAWLWSRLRRRQGELRRKM